MKNQSIEEEVQNITKQLVEKYKPEKIILFGSAARGEFSEDSDLDFLIIKKNTPYYGVERMRQVERLVQTSLPCDFLVARPGEVKRRLSLGDPFVKEIIYKGKVLYG